MFMTANDLTKISPILSDRCTVIHFPSANAARIKSISKKYVDKKLNDSIYHSIRFDYDLLDAQIDELVRHDVTSIRKYQQMIEAVLEKALTVALESEADNAVFVSEEMLATAANAVLGSENRRVGFA